MELKLVLIDESIDLSSFNCGNKYINRFLKEQACHNSLTNKSSTKLFLDKQNTIIGFYTVKVDSFKYEDEEETYSVIYLDYIAVDSKYQGKGYGSELLDDFHYKAMETAEFLGLMGVLLKAVPDKKEWYESRGFISLGEIEENLILMLYDIRTEAHSRYRDSFDY